MHTFTTNTAIAFLGMGLMGSRMSKRLLDAGFPIAVWNRSIAACEPLFAQGAKSLIFEDLVNYPIIMLCLADDQAVQSTIDKIRPYLRSGQIIIDFSSLSVHTTTALAQQLVTQQIIWIDSPVSGGTFGAEQGSLVVFAGGDIDLINALQPIYAPLSQRVSCMGKTGTGQATKICNQLIVAASSTLIAEAVALAEQAGVDTQLLAPALAGGFADSKPLQILAPRMAIQQFEPVQWKVQTLSKDLSNAVQLATQLQLDIPVAKHALTQLQQHQQQGYAQRDLSTIILNIKNTN
ncbi:NAD(P)-dependent oxidoreductase [Acinetobacter qingfengensis]|uniref:3-hydroxyisobutyrate dehydrogenase n=1 Tax=Acinetobacter qingfengensis TaxID=1262585 RepID=A0A1E7QXD8_9GAMM|nr:NAD(P)-dependent oxidoreductase [Acinetobacter qingfengensis]KAA8731634.1 NAD(P)-dependent oxidoreductase [Acinetobacter qingfengensis]OEY91737.1 3-hydroxyisobutyrate dehydrogenase [Acinetobacter qingfengensis]